MCTDDVASYTLNDLANDTDLWNMDPANDLFSQFMQPSREELEKDLREQMQNESMESASKYKHDWLPAIGSNPLKFVKPSNWDECERCTKRNPRDRHVGEVIYNPLGQPCCHVVVVPRHTDEFQDIACRFPETFRIKNICRVQNEDLTARFYERKYLMEEDRGRSVAVSELMFHSSVGNLEDLVGEGLDFRLGSIGFFGRGNYCTPYIEKAATYWKGTSERFIVFGVEVLLGDCLDHEDGMFDQTYRKEPYGFDSVSGNMTGEKEFVVYRNDQINIKYVIYYYPDDAFIRDKVHVATNKVVLPVKPINADAYITEIRGMKRCAVKLKPPPPLPTVADPPPPPPAPTGVQTPLNSILQYNTTLPTLPAPVQSQPKRKNDD
jgi:hypothetical protein